MITKRSQWIRILGGLTAFCLCDALPVHAQGQRGTGGGGSSSTSRQYVPNGDIGPVTFGSSPDTKQITFITDEETAKYVKQVIASLDRPKPQVLIKVIFLEVTYNNSLDIGVEGAIAGGYRHTSAVASNIFGLAATGASAASPAGMYTILGKDFAATLRAIAQAGKTEVLSRPSILTRNNQQATISLGQQVPLITATRFDTLGNQINSVTYQSIGVILQVTPFITSAGMVEMIVSPQISELADKSQWVPISNGTGGSISAPVINSRSADTVVVVPDGQTVVIGGLMENDKTTTDDKIPILGDIPLIGNAFKHSVKTYTKTELIVFLTPHIVNQPTELAGLSARERANSVLMPKEFTEEELERFLDTLPAKRSAAPAKAVPQSNFSSQSPQTQK
jgi:general secretion pathway protein D